MAIKQLTANQLLVNEVSVNEAPAKEGSENDGLVAGRLDSEKVNSEKVSRESLGIEQSVSEKSGNQTLVNEGSVKTISLKELRFNYFHSLIFLGLALSLGLVLNLFELLQWTESLPPGPLAYHLNRWAHGMMVNPFLNTLQEPRVLTRAIGEQPWVGDLMSSLESSKIMAHGRVTIGEPSAELESETQAPLVIESEGRSLASMNQRGTKTLNAVSGAVVAQTESINAEKFLFAGDSMLGSALQFKIKSYFVREFKGAKAYKIIAKSGTGLTKPNLFDWSEVIPKELASSPVDVLVLFLGTNDNGHIRSEGHAYSFGGKRWDGAYGDRLRGLVENSCKKVRKVLWVNQLPMADPETDQKMKHLNELAKGIVEKTSCGIYVDSQAWLSATGDFVGHLAIADEEGHLREVKIRNNDGVHLTDAGARIVTSKLVAFLKTRKLIEP